MTLYLCTETVTIFIKTYLICRIFYSRAKEAQDIRVIAIYGSGGGTESVSCTLSLLRSLGVSRALQCTGSYTRFYPFNPINIDNSINLHWRVYFNTVGTETDSRGLGRYYVGWWGWPHICRLPNSCHVKTVNTCTIVKPPNLNNTSRR